MFNFKRAQLAIDLLGQYITPKVNSIPQDKTADVESQDNCFLDSFYDNNQNDLLSTLRAAEGYSTSASPLVRLLIPRIPSPSLDLIETIVNIFCKGNEPKQALNYLTIQIEASQQQQQNCNSCSNEASSMFLHSKKLYVARKYYHQSTHHVAALEAFLPVVENRFGIASVRALEIKRELSLIMYDRGDKEQARILYREAVMILEGMKEVGKDQGEEKDGGSDKGGCLQVKDQHSEGPTERMGIKSKLRKWDKILVEREELDRKRAALWGSDGHFEIVGNTVRCLDHFLEPPKPVEDDFENIADLLEQLPILSVDTSKHFVKKGKHRPEIKNLLLCQGGSAPGEPKSQNIIRLLGKTHTGEVIFEKHLTCQVVIRRSSTLATIRVWILDMIDALSCLHSLGIIHRDLRIDNCLFSNDDTRLVLCDLKSRWGQRSPPEIASEGILDDAGWSSKSDIYCIGDSDLRQCSYYQLR
ncbi:hypothetical protein DL95DRAFT_469455 [Leptodontidium sp. 2 PMI_412]|nr:hypothetical protein DL95DRAFT_469455 [Leptodontidium sp. 2 PMI_412]